MKDGLYEQIITNQIKKQLLDTKQFIEKTKIDKSESAKILSQYVAELLEMELEVQKEAGKSIEDQISYINNVILAASSDTFGESQDHQIAEEAEQLLALLKQENQAVTIQHPQNFHLPRPETSIARSSLFTGAVLEPQMYSELKKEIRSCNRIDMLVSFIKWSGLRLLLDELQLFTQNGGILRIITTSYMGATDVKAINELCKLPNTAIKVSYDTKRTRLHAKTYVFYRETGFTTAYVGSSNMSNAAMTSGMEWNVKVTKKDLPETINKIEATFDSYWNSNEFVLYTKEQEERLSKALKAEKHSRSGAENTYFLDVTPYSYQASILERLQVERKIRGHYRNLIVAATGTGKTVIAAFDYLRYCKDHPGKNCRLLFVAHREEILKQSLDTFRAVLKDANFGEMLVGSYKPDCLDHLFVSIQSLNSKRLIDNISSDFYSYLIVDEFHHAAARTYQAVLNHFNPEILLGLTATPERMDGKDVIEYFDGRIAAEIRLPEAIDRKLLCPFQYFGVTDIVDLNDIRWTRGGYDRKELEKVYVFSREVAKRRADHVVRQVLKYVTDIDEVKGLGFCVSIEHAVFMSDYFCSVGIPSVSVTSNTSEGEREQAKKKLAAGDVRFIFVVDVYNEGVDIPEVNTVLFLRPTESLTIFLQQLGRGLRLAEGKECLTVLDFIGQANKKYHFEDKFAALLSTTGRNISREIRNGFTSLPKGCYIQLEKKATKSILENIKASYGTAAGLVSRIESFEEDAGKPLTLSNFLNHYHLNPPEIYKFKTFARLCVMAGVKADYNEPLEEDLKNGFLRFSSVDSRRWISFILYLLTMPENNYKQLNAETDFNKFELRMLQMFQYTVWGKAYADCGFSTLLEGIEKIRGCKELCAELIELLQYQYDKIDILDEPVDVGFDCPLDLHCNYTRDQILVAMDFMKPDSHREGVKHLPDKKIDVFFVTLNKTDKDYSPTTMYKDYSINEDLFHWQSQSTTAEDSPTGKRYIHHEENGSRVVIFVRENKKDPISGKATPYTYLGTAKYVSHEGSRPMSIIWKLDKPIPAKYLQKTNRLLVV